MMAVGNYACIKIDNTTTTSGISIKNDGIGVCVSCPSMKDIVGKTVLFDTNHIHHEYEEYLIMENKWILAVID